MAVMEAASASERRRLKVVPSVSCRPGCNGCCSRHVEVTVAEAAVMVLWLRRRGLWDGVKRAAEEQASLARRTPPDAWFKMNIKCPALSREDGTCAAHQVRPPSCSTHYAASDPAACDPWVSSEREYLPVDFTDIYVDSQKSIRDTLKADGILLLQLPMSLALLLADRVAAGAAKSYEEAVSIMRDET